jgi:hypothetical protein
MRLGEAVKGADESHEIQIESLIHFAPWTISQIIATSTAITVSPARRPIASTSPSSSA